MSPAFERSRLWIGSVFGGGKSDLTGSWERQSGNPDAFRSCRRIK
jgi:hypothetical protein